MRPFPNPFDLNSNSTQTEEATESRDCDLSQVLLRTGKTGNEQRILFHAIDERLMKERLDQLTEEREKIVSFLQKMTEKMKKSPDRSEED
ncbi:hypothetical protein GEMRC1_010990 [Eukaryota sp. GEM-RC1]